MKIVTVMAPRKESTIGLSRHAWFLTLWEKLQLQLGRVVKPVEVEAVICATRDCSGLIKEMYCEFYSTDVDVVNQHMRMIERMREHETRILPSMAVREDMAIFVLKEPASEAAPAL